ncbi:MAG TPA: hypothetical protein P5120_06510 [Spirochaetota bacterium]|nr:hypothetical protein [Spirochaetota bacterium]HPF06127.1 hypothetical protein [Spirochaetota bacterium]HPJ43650.1 hypothetical protein [Spirochaetota bacterium]HPR37189.1 hypothetical protein [Spirochaetota bacterium]HRX47152.1 hypothetical protein [Spirochaetota bacterium]
MKRLLIFITFMFFTIVLQPDLSFALDTEALSPTQPPRLPVTDYDSGTHIITDVMYLHYSFDEFDLDGGGIGANYVDNYEKIGYNFGGGITYLQGSASDIDLDVYCPLLSLNANIGYRLAGNPDTSSFMVFGGIHWMYMWFVATYGEYDAFIYGPVFGPLAGAKAEIKMTPSVSIIPYYVFHHAIYDITVEVEGIEQDVDIDPVTSHLLGFDIKFGEFSIGALIDTLNNTDNKKITILFSYDLNITDDEDLNRGNVQQPEKQKAKRPARTQRNVKEGK